MSEAVLNFTFIHEIHADIKVFCFTHFVKVEHTALHLIVVL